MMKAFASSATLPYLQPWSIDFILHAGRRLLRRLGEIGHCLFRIGEGASISALRRAIHLAGLVQMGQHMGQTAVRFLC